MCFRERRLYVCFVLVFFFVWFFVTSIIKLVSAIGGRSDCVVVRDHHDAYYFRTSPHASSLALTMSDNVDTVFIALRRTGCFVFIATNVLILTKNLCAFRSSRWSIENRAIDSAAFAKVDRTCNEIGISFFCACFCRRWIDRTRWFDLHVCMFAQFVSVRDAQYSAPPYRLSLQRCRHHVAFYHVDSLYWRAESFRSLLGMLFVPSFSPFLFLLFLCSSCTTDKQTLSYKKRHCVLQDAFVVSSEKWHF